MVQVQGETVSTALMIVFFVEDQGEKGSPMRVSNASPTSQFSQGPRVALPRGSGRRGRRDGRRSKRRASRRVFVRVFHVFRRTRSGATSSLVTS